MDKKVDMLVDIIDYLKLELVEKRDHLTRELVQRFNQKLPKIIKRVKDYELSDRFLKIYFKDIKPKKFEDFLHEFILCIADCLETESEGNNEYILELNDEMKFEFEDECESRFELVFNNEKDAQYFMVYHNMKTFGDKLKITSIVGKDEVLHELEISNYEEIHSTWCKKVLNYWKLEINNNLIYKNSEGRFFIIQIYDEKMKEIGIREIEHRYNADIVFLDKIIDIEEVE